MGKKRKEVVLQIWPSAVNPESRCRACYLAGEKDSVSSLVTTPHRRLPVPDLRF
jgi:hypothetical protein